MKTSKLCRQDKSNGIDFKNYLLKVSITSLKPHEKDGASNVLMTKYCRHKAPNRIIIIETPQVSNPRMGCVRTAHLLTQDTKIYTDNPSLKNVNYGNA